jgi:hypothetical protein
MGLRVLQKVEKIIREEMNNSGAQEVLNEFAHGWVANQYGDATAKMLGRLTLNPIKHIDPIGTILFQFIIFISQMVWQ